MDKDNFELYLVEATIENKLHRTVYTVSTVPEAYDKFMSELKNNQDIQKMKSLSIKRGIVPLDVFK
ncbi:hypothetical protein [Pseudalkalibacillus decolorationis]|uniref:hypothetical protein n=1 Tax=Pseudalkalibacillus decolorationis TaxID=163879 RepID=UPI00214757B8|nr:hypothetical protein [Pseudalkalibacillus decolorationis]